MSNFVELRWEYADAEDDRLDFCRVLYAYLDSESSEILYIGKADFSTVRERLYGPHKEAIFDAFVNEINLSILHVIVGVLSLPKNSRFSSQLLSDIESLLIMEVQPSFNKQSRKSRIARPGLVVQCVGDWPHVVRKFVDS